MRNLVITLAWDDEDALWGAEVYRQGPPDDREECELTLITASDSATWDGPSLEDLNRDQVKRARIRLVRAFPGARIFTP